MSLFKQGTRSNPTVLTTKTSGKNSFIHFKKKGNAGEYQEDFLVYKVKKVNNKIMNFIYILNPYTLGLVKSEEDGSFNGVENKNAMILQDKEGTLYLVIHEEGRKVRHTRTISYWEMRTTLGYTPALNEIADIDTENEYKFKIDTELQDFEPFGIEDITLVGYPLTFIKSLLPVNNTKILSSELGEEIDANVIEVEEIEELEVDEIENFDLDELV